MKPEIEEQILESLKWVGETAQDSKDFLLEQAPLYCQEVVAYEIWRQSIFITTSLFVSLLFFGLGVYLYRKILWHENYARKMGKPCIDTSIKHFVLNVFIALSLISFLASVPNSTIKIIKAKTAPRVLIVEHLQGKLK